MAAAGLALVASPAWGVDAAPAVEPPLRVSMASWGVAEGLPGAQVNQTAQDADGTLWLATLAGLVHFDGFDFEVFDETNSDLPSSRLTTVVRGGGDQLWIGTEQGHLIAYRDGAFRLIAEPPYPGARIASMVEDGAGSVWLSRDADPALPDQPLVWQLAGDELVPRKDLDRLWVVANGDGVVGGLGHDGQWFPLAQRDMVVALSVDDEGRAWGQLPLGRLVRLDDGTSDPAGAPFMGATELARTFATRVDGDRVTIRTLAGEPIGSVPVAPWRVVWLVDRRGLIWTTRDRHLLEAFRGDDPEPVVSLEIGDDLRDVVEDRDGNLWLGTLTRGLIRVAESPLETFGVEQGMPIPAAVGLTPNGQVFVEAGPILQFQPLYRLVAGRGEIVEGARGWLLWDRRGWRWTFEKDVLVGEGHGESVRIPASEGTWMVEDPDRTGVLWLVDRQNLRRLETGGGAQAEITGSWPLKANRALVSDGAGGLWIGATDGLWHLVRDRLTQFGVREGLPVANVRAVVSDGGRGWWLGTYGGGLVHFDGTHFTVLDSSRGLPESIVSSLIFDRRGDLWFAGNRGIYRIRRSSLDAALASPTELLDVLALGPDDGLANPETTGRPAVMTADGRLWFGTFGGLAAIDPAAIERREANAVEVLVRSITSPDAAHPPGPPVAIAPNGSRDVTFAFTATHLAAPGTLSFRYRLDPLEDAWVDGDATRTARYRGLPPGTYRFRVQARHSGGVWREPAQAQELTVAPRFPETGAFTALLAVLALTAGAALWQLATRQVRRRARQLEVAVGLRTSELARERDLVSRQATRLAELAEARAQFMAAVSHELRTPLTLILGPLSDLREGRLGELPPAARREVETTLTSADRLHRLVDRLLGVARAEIELSRLACRESDLVTFVARLVAELQPLAARRGSSLVWRPPARPLPIWFDELQLESVIVNLVANAIKHTPAGSTVEVEVAPSAEGEAAVLTVRDDGPGIPDDELPRLFERFYRGRAAAGDARGGFGLGLSVVRQVVERHGGRIDVTSGEGGTTFLVRLRVGADHLGADDRADFDQAGVPLRAPSLALAEDPPSRDGEPPPPGPGPEAADPTVADPNAATTADDASDLDRRTVLVVDDNADLRRLVRRQLEPEYRVLEAEDGERALEMLADQLPDLVLSDVMMPGMDGIELCRAIRADPEVAFVPVLLLTAKASAASRIEGLDEGADGYLAKPFHGGVLRSTVNSLIASRHRLLEHYAAAARTGERIAPQTEIRAERPDMSAADRSYLEKLHGTIARHLHDESFDVDRLAGLMYQSRASLYRHVRRLLDVSPSDLIRESRLARARALIERGDGSISEIAYAVGFKSLAHFSNSFRERFGARPSAMGRH